MRLTLGSLHQERWFLPLLRGQAAFRSERLPSSIGPHERHALASASSRSPWPGFASKIPHPVRPRDSSRAVPSKSPLASRQLARSDPKGSLRSLRRTGPQARRVDVCSPPIRCFQRRAPASRWLPVSSRACARSSPVEQLVHGEPPRSRRVAIRARGIVLPHARSLDRTSRHPVASLAARPAGLLSRAV